MDNITKAKKLVDFYTKKKESDFKAKTEEMDKWTAPFKVIAKSGYFYDFETNTVNFGNSIFKVQKCNNHYFLTFFGFKIGVKKEIPMFNLGFVMKHTSLRYELTEDEALEAMAEFEIIGKSDKYSKGGK